ncbi:MAG: SDR family oxidoreductase [Deltaproteobacteria bacterium]|jgi:3-oxoacyl-[acyl-carrier protein] reductase|nr:SDR family oxidoreductase [Deltaproteobacteria bacterium]
MRLEDRVFVVTGAGSGIGRAISLRFAEEGARVAALDLKPETAEETRAMLAGSGHFAGEVDVADGPSVAKAFGEIDAAMGRVQGLVNNAGIDHAPGDAQEKLFETGQQLIHMSDEGFARLMAVNVNGIFHCTREAVRLMQRDGLSGSIINMSSVAGLAGQGGVSYSASKSAVLGFTRAAAMELGPFGIRVNAICPGVIETPMTAGVPASVLDPLVKAAPLGRTGKPSDIADTALFLAGYESSYITGQFISPNGGMLMC